MIEKAYAKMNLGLNVLDKRENGYHNLETIMLPLELHDTIEISFLPNDVTDDFVTCDEYSLKVTRYNLCHKAIDVCRVKRNITNKFRVVIHKRIFIQSGLGGGSADAAATVRGIIKLLKINPTYDELMEIALQLGSDVPFCMLNKSSIVKGIGDQVTVFENTRYDDFVLIVKHPIGLSTEEVFIKSDEFGKNPCDIERLKNKFLSNDVSLKDEIKNDLFEPSCSLLPQIKELYESLLQEGFEFVTMTGSGSALVCFTKNKKVAQKAERKYYNKGYQVELTKILKN
ncbi:MAG: 4-(cytidine 5'-diphospho)-2-C-methyl-D-erythritol kinase [Candidatus Onthovivens sp.]|nr:4-(cytidine 5'-diphospho)-2-C-methyl-D-erythritol kinase [Candidatus Onthovivens sp.]